MGTRRGGSTLPLFKRRQNVSNLQILYNECSQILYYIPEPYYSTKFDSVLWNTATAL